MAKIEAAKPKAKKVRFIKAFSGNLNGFAVNVTYRDAEKGVTLELPPVVYDWIQKFRVCHDA